MNEFARLLHEFPFLGAFLGGIVGLCGSIAFFFIFGRKINPMYANIVRDLGEAEKVLIESHKATLVMQKEHYEAELIYLKEALAKVEVVRDEYKTKLHAANNVNNNLNLQIVELQSRPDLQKVYTDQKGFFTEMISTMKAMHEMIVSHDKGIEERTAKIIEPVKTMCAAVAEALNKLKVQT